MTNTPSDPDYPSPKRLAGLMRAFDYAVTGKQQAHVMGEEFRKVNAAEQIEALKQIGINDEPTITYVLRQKGTSPQIEPLLYVPLHQRQHQASQVQR